MGQGVCHIIHLHDLAFHINPGYVLPCSCVTEEEPQREGTANVSLLGRELRLQSRSVPSQAEQTRPGYLNSDIIPYLAFFFFKLTLEKPSNLREMNFILHIKGNNNSELPSPHKKIPRSYFSHFFSGGGPCWAMFWVKR